MIWGELRVQLQGVMGKVQSVRCGSRGQKCLGVMDWVISCPSMQLWPHSTVAITVFGQTTGCLGSWVGPHLLWWICDPFLSVHSLCLVYSLCGIKFFSGLLSAALCVIFCLLSVWCRILGCCGLLLLLFTCCLCDTSFNLVWVTFLSIVHLLSVWCEVQFLGLSDLSMLTLLVLCLIQGVLMFVLVTHYHTVY